MANNIFLVTSAINTDSGVMSNIDRIQQTIETANSIRRYASKNTKIILLEGGQSPLVLNQRDQLNTVYDDIIDFTFHPTIRFIHSQKIDSMYVKGPCESFMLCAACNLLPRDEQYRIFKISGRYNLTEQFDESAHDVNGKYVFLDRQNGVHYYYGDASDQNNPLRNIEKYYTEYQYKTRLYSFCSTILDIASQNYVKIFDTIINSYDDHGFIDLEHATYRVVDQSIVHELPIIGVSGIQAPNGITIKE